MKILLIEDEKITRITLGDTLRDEGHSIKTSIDGNEGLKAIKNDSYDVVISDLNLPGISGLEILEYSKKKNPRCEFIIMTAYASVETAIEALKKGAYDYITKPFHPDELVTMINHISDFNRVLRENRELKKIVKKEEKAVELIGHSPVMQKLRDTIKLIAGRDYTVLITGKSGTGKEMAAREIHRASDRNTKPFIAVNCAVIPENLLESELFGHEKGAFSGAIKRHIGYFERADGGILFIDDIDDFPLPLQVKLLRVLQEREFNRVGGSETISVDVRILAATKVDLQDKVKTGEFREDLFYRLNIIPLSIAALCLRKEDIPLLLNHFFARNNAKLRADKIEIGLMKEIMDYEWPGNVRELENVARRLIALPETISLNLRDNSGANLSEESTSDGFEEKDFTGYMDYMDNISRKIIRQALRQWNNNISEAAKFLKIPRSTLRSKMEKLNLIEGKKNK